MLIFDKPVDTESFKMRLRNLREYYGYNQADVAQILHISRSTYTYYESGKMQPKINTLIKLAVLYNISLNYLLCGGQKKSYCFDFECFGNRLCSLRSQQGISQKDVAQLLHINNSTYNNYELGKAQPEINTLIKLAILYRVSLSYLLCGNKETNYHFTTKSFGNRLFYLRKQRGLRQSDLA